MGGNISTFERRNILANNDIILSFYENRLLKNQITNLIIENDKLKNQIDLLVNGIKKYNNAIIKASGENECPVCFEKIYIVDFICSNSIKHILCHNCSKKINICPICRSQ